MEISSRVLGKENKIQLDKKSVIEFCFAEQNWGFVPSCIRVSFNDDGTLNINADCEISLIPKASNCIDVKLNKY